MATMAAFALGTMPSLFAVGLAARSAQQRRARPALRRIAGASIAAAGVYGLVQLGLHAAALHDLCVLPLGGS
jgi:sulfite exporter TauE/SafE